MRINFLLPTVEISGGIRVVFEYADRLLARGHEVILLYPIVPPRMDKRWLAPKPRTTQVLGAVKRIIKNDRANWFDPDAPIREILTINPKVIQYADGAIPEADVTIATSWETAWAVAVLDDSIGRKVHFVQHYEIWETWNCDQAWDQVTDLTDNPKSYPVEMYEVTPSDASTRRQKELVDSAYNFPFPKITISSWLAELLETKFNQNVVSVITNSVNHSEFYPENITTGEKLTLLLPYRRAPWKGRREAEHLIYQIMDSYDIKINTYGPRWSPPDLPREVKHHTNISDSKLRRLYSSADIFVLPSWVEGCQLPPLEAMACNCAVVATNVGGVPDYVEHGVTASVVPPRDGPKLVNAVVELIENKEKRERLQQNGRESVTEYSWDEATVQFEQALKEILRNEY